MYVEKKKIKGKMYNYLKVSGRINGKVVTKTIAYLGKAPMSKEEITARISHIPKIRIEMVEKQMKQGTISVPQFFSKEQAKKLEDIRKDFSKKLGRQDKKIIEDMFKDFKTFYIYNTNAIEGNTLTLQETNLLLNENQTPSGKDLREIYDHINEKNTFDFIIKNRPAINKNIIIQIHSMLMQGIDKRTGNFRAHEVGVFGATFETSPARYVDADIALLLNWYRKNMKKLHPLALAAVFHEKFERIHPFYDGNGRTGRMLSNLILLYNNYPPLIIQNAKRMKYYDALSAGHRAELTGMDFNLYNPIVDFFYEELIATYERVFAKWG